MNSQSLRPIKKPFERGPNLAHVPLHLRRCLQTSTWPSPPSPQYQPQLPLPSRNYGNGLFRRYATGALDVDWAKGLVLEARRKVKAEIPLQEVEALALSAVFPQLEFEGLPREIVAVKAFLTPSERFAIQCKIQCEDRQHVATTGFYSGW